MKSNLIKLSGAIEGLEAARVLAAMTTVKEVKRQLLMASTQLRSERVALWAVKRRRARLNFHGGSRQRHLVK